MTATMVQDPDHEIATLRERVEALRPKLDDAKREAEEARSALVVGLETPMKAANAQSRLNALQGAYDEVAARLSELEGHKRREIAERLAEAARAKQLEKLAAAARAATASYDRALQAYERIVDVVEKEVETIARARIDLREHLRERDALMDTVDVREGELDVYLGRYDVQVESPDFRSDVRLREAVRPRVEQAEHRLRRAAERG